MDFRKILVAALFLVAVDSRPQTLQDGMDEIDRLQNELIPYYGGAKGRYLKITKNSRGDIINQVIIDTEPITSESQRPDRKRTAAERFLANLNKIQTSAQHLIYLQNTVKREGPLTPDDQKVYDSNLALLNDAVSQLSVFNSEGALELAGSAGAPGNDEDQSSGREPAVTDLNADEENGGFQDTEEGGKDENEQIELPASDVSLAEAKPVGLSVAGAGGVASSNPKATAIAGAGGLAISNPVATAIAGVDPHDVPHAAKKRQKPGFKQSAYVDRRA